MPHAQSQQETPHYLMTQLSEKVLILKDLLTIATRQDELPWEPFRPGIEIYRLYGNGCVGSAAALLRYQPGACVPNHIHRGFEHILVLSGSQSDRNGEHTTGTLAINPPGTSHSVVSEAGCIVLAIWEKPVSFIEKES
jgi:anti-sigma factor ChrR (cupin superfamily)